MQQEIFNRQVKLKTEKQPTENHLILLSITCLHFRQKWQSQNMLISDEMLKAINATYYKVDRGGDITYHGQGTNCRISHFRSRSYGINLQRIYQQVGRIYYPIFEKGAQYYCLSIR